MRGSLEFLVQGWFTGASFKIHVEKVLVNFTIQCMGGLAHPIKSLPKLTGHPLFCLDYKTFRL